MGAREKKEEMEREFVYEPMNCLIYKLQNMFCFLVKEMLEIKRNKHKVSRNEGTTPPLNRITTRQREIELTKKNLVRRPSTKMSPTSN